jgi:hypothetical protein
MNLVTDQSKHSDIVGLIFQPNEIELIGKANATLEHYNPITIEILKQVKLEDSAENNEAVLEALKEICKVVRYELIDTGYFDSLQPFRILKVLETKYDANFIGWAIPLDLLYLKNENKC